MTEEIKRFPGIVVEVTSRYKIVFNRGSKDRVHVGDKFLVYTLSDKEILDPISQEPLGKIEYVKGIGVAVHVQENLTTLEAEKKTINERIIKKLTKGDNWAAILSGGQKDEEEVITQKTIYTEFEDAKTGDLVKRI